jgi:exodeoxyribonuclease VIII
MTPGFYLADDLSNEKYHAGPGVSNSGLKLIGDKTPLHFWGRYIAAQRPKFTSTAAMFVGTAFHAASLEPHKFDDEYVVANFKDRRAAGYKAWAEEQNKHILMAGEMTNVIGMRRALFEHPVAGGLLRGGGHFEYSAYAEDPETGVLVRARADFMSDGGWIVDLKKTQDASPAGCRKAIENYGYWQQDPFYLDVFALAGGELPRGFVFIFVEEEFPHAVNVVYLTEEDRQRGRRIYRNNLRLYAQCLERNEWPGYGKQASELELSMWARRRIDDALSNEEF